jgi:2-octaprenyl-6-methoxyphenol hydroxylase
MRETTDILISGGGIAGMAAAAAFGTAGFGVICVDPAPPPASGEDAGADLRTTAFLQPSRALLAEAGLWGRLAPHATALQVMRIVDLDASSATPRRTADFDAAEVSPDAPFGWNLPNWLVARELRARLAELPNISFRAGIGTERVLTRESSVIVTLTGGTTIEAALLIAADGRASPVREALGIPVTTHRYGQKALAFAVTHPVPHRNVSTEVHLSGGPFTLVPLPDREGLPASAVVWMELAGEAERLAQLPVPEFDALMSARSGRVLGPLALASRRSVWPIIAQIAGRFAGERAALIAEAAHVVPPIGAQGLNMSLADIACLLGHAREAHGGLGARAMLDAYHRRRWPEVKARVTGIDLLNRASMAGSAQLRDLRARALGLMHETAPVRRVLMKAGMGVR